MKDRDGELNVTLSHINTKQVWLGWMAVASLKPTTRTLARGGA